MIPELGHFALWLALATALLLGILPLAGALRGRDDWMALARPLARRAVRARRRSRSSASLRPSCGNDFSVLYVAQHSNSALPLAYRIAGVWGGHEGSLLLWALMLCVWMAAVARFSRHLPLPVLARILGVMGWVAVGFLLFTLVTSNPFERLFPVPADGRDLNPLLQDPGMVIHPPMLYMGYVGFSVAFAFAVAALIGGNLDAHWARWTRPWTMAAWMFLTVGIALGSWWAYYELGWGGWWFWDPVENASFMPWLVGTALIHSLAVTEKRGALQVLDRAAGDHGLLAVAARHLPRALGRADVGARLRHRPAARPLHPAFLVVVDRRLAHAVRLARAEGRPGRALRAAVARDAAARQQRAAGRRPGAPCCSARCTRWCSTRWASARSRSARRTSTPCSCR